MSNSPSSPQVATREAIVSVHDGAVYWHGRFKDADDCARLLAEFRRPCLAGDWFKPHAQRISDDLEAAMRAAGYIEAQERAA